MLLAYNIRAGVHHILSGYDIEPSKDHHESAQDDQHDPYDLHTFEVMESKMAQNLCHKKRARSVSLLFFMNLWANDLSNSLTVGKQCNNSSHN